jgi:hypothetical protein
MNLQVIGHGQSIGEWFESGRRHNFELLMLIRDDADSGSGGPLVRLTSGL